LLTDQDEMCNLLYKVSSNRIKGEWHRLGPLSL
jgi:hypothetical protein